MFEMIEDRKGSAVLEERRDLLSNLVRASMEKSDSEKGRRVHASRLAWEHFRLFACR